MVITFLDKGINPQVLGQVDFPTPTSTEEPTTDVAWVSAIRQLMITNNECQLPCFWGFEPGEAEIRDILEFLSDIDEDDIIMTQINDTPVVGDNGELGYNFILRFEPDTSLLVGLSTRDSVLFQTSVMINHPGELLADSIFEVSHILQMLGEPTEIFVALRGPTPSTFSLTLVYNDESVMVRYLINSQEPFNRMNPDQPLQLCPSMDRIELIFAWLQSPESETSVEENFPGLRDDTLPRSNWSLERISDNMNIETFTSLFFDDPDACIQLLSINQLIQQGYNF
jgi:hypothetical protein